MKSLIEFERELTALINKHGLERYASTPDFLLARYLVRQLRAYNQGVAELIGWHSGNIPTPVDEEREASMEAIIVFREFAQSNDRAHDILHELVIDAGEDDASRVTNQAEEDELSYLISLGWTTDDIRSGLLKAAGETE